MNDRAQEIGYKIGMWGTTILIIAVLIGLLTGLAKLVGWLAFRPKAAPLALSASFYDKESDSQKQGLKIHGEVHLPAAKEQNFWVKVFVETTDREFRQTSILTATNGMFDVDETRILGLRSLRDDIPIQVVAEVWNDAQDKRLVQEEMFINGQKPFLNLRMLGFVWFLLAVCAVFIFLKAFTGKKTEKKNQLAIEFSYCVIILGLALPLIVPIVLPHLFPNLMDMMSRKATPVGLVITRIESGKAGALTEPPQWVLNIGGAVERIEPSVPEQPPSATKTPGGPVAGEVTVHGGLVIPLWVIILSLIGGAINMTTKVPLYQEKMENEAEKASMVEATAKWLITRPMQLARQIMPNPPAGRTAEPVTNPPEPPLEEPPPAPEEKETEEPTAAPAEQADEAGHAERMHWRRGLLGLYMSLVSAPFLAIVTYYLLRWGDLDKTPILVIVSFCIGLLSVRIVRSLTDLAGGFIDQTRGKKVEPTTQES